MWHYVYILESADGAHYVGVTSDLRKRLGKHNRGEVSHTSKHISWDVVHFAAFRDRQKAAQYEHYLESGSERLFQRRHLL
ncbi:MAG: GIY-YIG nuclease family protein [Candidatus Peregrinibacteria bacterium]